MSEAMKIALGALGGTRKPTPDPDEWECGDCGAWVNGEWCTVCLPEHAEENASSRQVGGAHYLTAMQPWDIIDAHGLNYYEGNVLKYLLRHRKKNGVEDLKKARHYLDKLIETEE